jgi:hypothetical protein
MADEGIRVNLAYGQSLRHQTEKTKPRVSIEPAGAAACSGVGLGSCSEGVTFAHTPTPPPGSGSPSDHHAPGHPADG